MDKLKQAKKLLTLQDEPNLALFDEIGSVNGKLNAIKDVLKSINVKEVKTYESELETLVEGISSLSEALQNKDLSVNVDVPLDSLASSINSVEKAIKAIKIDFPKQLDTLKLDDEQVNAILLEIQAIPEFPIAELSKMFKSLEARVGEIKMLEPEMFDYVRLERKLDSVVKAIKGISITVGGGGGLGTETFNNGVNTLNKGEKIPSYDKSVITWDTDGNPLTITYSLAGVTVATKTITWVNGDPTEIVITY